MNISDIIGTLSKFARMLPKETYKQFGRMLMDEIIEFTWDNMDNLSRDADGEMLMPAMGLSIPSSMAKPFARHIDRKLGEFADEHVLGDKSEVDDDLIMPMLSGLRDSITCETC